MDYSLWLSVIFGKNVTGIKKSLLGHHLKALLMLITMEQSPASYLIHAARYSALKTSSDIHVNWCFRSEMVLQFHLKQS